jgi:hypothetical protein
MSKEIVITPLTEKCFLTMFNALNAFKCGTISGAACSGKKNTINLLAQVILILIEKNILNKSFFLV